MNDTEYRERCRELEKNIHMLESEVNVLNNECEKLLDLKEKSRNSLQMSSCGNNPIFVEKAQVNMEKEIPTIGKSQDKKTEDKSEISQCLPLVSFFFTSWFIRCVGSSLVGLPPSTRPQRIR